MLDQVVDLNGVPSEKFIQAGIVSFGAGCANPDSPGYLILACMIVLTIFYILF